MTMNNPCKYRREEYSRGEIRGQEKVKEVEWGKLVDLVTMIGITKE